MASVSGGPFVLVSGTHTSTKSAPDYVAHIVYGDPEIFAVTVGSHFVALCRYENDDTGWARARSTFERMFSFPHGATLIADSDVAWREYGLLVAHFAPKPTEVPQ